MLNKLKKTSANKDGFTIIEVMIVLAIAGLILLIVFLAVPALERSSRNTSRKTDVGRIGSAIQTIISNQNGSISGVTAANIRAEVGSNLSYYTPTNISVAAAAPTSTVNASTTTTVVVYPGATCVSFGTGEGATNAGADPDQFAITYYDEAGSGSTPECTTE